ncbi:G-protein gamma-like domain-containing protein [Radiomyces spectabilis]|uniref:G-protein gamma-like domain-containing protein n=1 Tax=Radiomyces spectabilis TaxID=64574 RepID=UPI0022207A1B|nr:G-protein gamma-like domain-containing protein [Radiomyces spectabilis]KAI8372787.1 G-protein gamma-like domain-containing protein [Radiomyces spectabilis]
MEQKETEKRSQRLSESKLKRLLETNEKLTDQLNMNRIPVSEAARHLIDYCSNTPDPLVPSLWGRMEDAPFLDTRSKFRCCHIM